MKGCTVPECGRKAKARGLCGSHYNAWLRSVGGRVTGDQSGPSPLRVEIAEEALFLLSCGVAVTDALERVGWTVGAAYRWALRHRHAVLLEATRAEANRRAWRQQKARAA